MPDSKSNVSTVDSTTSQDIG